MIENEQVITFSNPNQILKFIKLMARVDIIKLQKWNETYQRVCHSFNQFSASQTTKKKKELCQALKIILVSNKIK